METAHNLRNRLAIPRSIRWRLPLSYAGIALLAVLALGGVLLITLRNYYEQRERTYLENNGRVIGIVLEQMYHDGLPESAFQAAVNISSFVTGARVCLLDTEQQVLADSGTSPGRDLITLNITELRSEGTSRIFRPFLSIYREGQPPGDFFREDPGRGGDTSREEQGLGAWVQDQTYSLWAEANQVFRSFISIYQEGQPPGNLLWENPGREDGAAPVDTSPEDLDLGAWFQDQTYSLWAEGEPFGYYLSPDEPAASVRSDQQVTMPLLDNQGDLLSYIKMSEGPAFGLEVVADVAQVFLGAGIVAVLVAGVVGWFASRNISQPVLDLTHVTKRMAAGQLSARVNLTRQDEFGSLARSFNTMADRIENTVVTLQRFVADAAHELNTPITALRTNLELAAYENEDGESQNDIGQALVELERLEGLTSSLLALARLEAKAVDVQHVSVDMGALARQMNERYASRAEQGNVTLALNLAQDQPIITQADEGQLVRMLDNLLDNALKFTPDGGTVVINLRADDQNVHLSVQDTGIGIPADDRAKLFSRFHRGQNVSAYPGNGLGLVIVKAIIEEHRGQVIVESNETGTCFFVRLPVGNEQREKRHDTG